MEFRMIVPEALPQVMELWDYCFEKKEEPFFQWYFQEYCLKDNNIVAGFEGQKLVNMLHLNMYSILVRGFREQLPYIVGVATAPEYRGQHLTAPLLQTTFEVLRSQHFTFALLMPINAGIYLPYAFSFCYFKHLYKLPLEKLQVPSPGAEVRVERVSSLEAGYFAPVYAAYAAHHHAMVVRTDFQWHKLLKVHSLEQVLAAVVYEEERPVGYMFYKILGEVFHIYELVTLSIAAKRALLRFATGHLSAATELYWEAAADDLTYLDFKDAGYSGTVLPFMMARCLDARSALAKLTGQLQLPEGASCTVLLTDQQIPRNNHLLQLSVQEGKLQVASTLEPEDLALDMGAFTQLYFGAFSAEELYHAGHIRVLNEHKLSFLQGLFPKCHNYINEYF